jgi:hypothetical protein
MEDIYFRLINCHLLICRSSASSFSSQYLHLFLKSSRRCVLLLPTPFTSVFISPFRENNNALVFPIPFHIFMSLANLWLIRIQGQFPILRTRVALNSTRSSALWKARLALGRWIILIPGFVQSPPTLAVYDVAHSLP